MSTRMGRASEPVSVSSDQAVNTTAVTCDEVLDACSLVVDGLERENALLKETLSLSTKALENQREESARLRAQHDAWYHDNPWLVFGIGVAVGGLAYSLYQQR